MMIRRALREDLMNGSLSLDLLLFAKLSLLDLQSIRDEIDADSIRIVMLLSIDLLHNQVMNINVASIESN